MVVFLYDAVDLGFGHLLFFIIKIIRESNLGKNCLISCSKNRFIINSSIIYEANKSIIRRPKAPIRQDKKAKNLELRASGSTARIKLKIQRRIASEIFSESREKRGGAD